MRLELFPLLLAVSLMNGCAHRAASKQPALPPVRSSPHPFEVQTRNATIAGSGDPRLQDLRRQIAARPGDVAARRQIAQYYAASGMPDLALDHVRAARASTPQDTELLLEELRILRTLHLTPEAAGTLDVYLRTYPDSDASLYSWLGILLDEAGAPERAEGAHRAALSRATDHPDVYMNNLGYHFLKRGRYEEAAAYFHNAVTANSNSASARNNLGLALAHQNAAPAREKALEAWNLSVDPAAAHTNLAAVLIEQGHYQEARRELKLALEYSRNYLPALQNLQLVSELDGEPATAGAIPHTSGWRRFTHSVKSYFAGSGPASDEAVKIKGSPEVASR